MIYRYGSTLYTMISSSSYFGLSSVSFTFLVKWLSQYHPIGLRPWIQTPQTFLISRHIYSTICNGILIAFILILFALHISTSKGTLFKMHNLLTIPNTFYSNRRISVLNFTIKCFSIKTIKLHFQVDAITVWKLH